MIKQYQMITSNFSLLVYNQNGFLNHWDASFMYINIELLIHGRFKIKVI